MDTIEVRGRRTDGSGRWFTMELALRPVRTGPFVNYSPGFACEFRAADDLSASYGLENWESGLVSGLLFALRRTPDRNWGVQVTSMKGEVGSADMPGVARAATIAALQLHGQEPPPSADGDWVFEVRRGPVVARAEAGSEAGSIVPPPASVS